MNANAMCARRKERASPSSIGALALEVKPVESVMSVIRVELRSVHPPAAVSDARLKRNPSVSNTSEEAVNAMVK